MATRRLKEERRKKKAAKKQRRQGLAAQVRGQLVPGSNRLLSASGFVEPTAAIPTGLPVVKIWDFIGEDITADDFAEQLEGITGDVVVSINSGGGSVFDAIAMHNLLVAHRGRVYVDIVGVAASAATYVAMAGDEIHIASNALFMVHKARGGIGGTEDEIRQYLELISRANSILLLAYAARTGMSADALDTLLSKDWWMTAAEALEAGFVTHIEDTTVQTAPHVQPGASDHGSDVRSTLSVSRARHALDQLVASVRGKARTPKSQGSDVMKFSEWLKALGLDESTLTADQKKKLRAKYDAEIKAQANGKIDDANGTGSPGNPPQNSGGGDSNNTPPQNSTPPATSQVNDGPNTPQPGEISAAMRTEATEERRRIRRIEQIAATEGVDTITLNADGQFDPNGTPVDFIEHAIGNDLSAMNAELLAVRAARPRANGPATHVAAGNTMTTIHAALMQCSQHTEEAITAALGEQALEAAERQYRGNMSLHAMLLDAAAINGFELRSVDAVKTQLRDVLQAAFSTNDLPGIIESNTRRTLVASFEKVESTWRAVAATAPVSDFKETPSYRLQAGGMEYDEIGPDGELKHGKLGETAYGNKAKTYGKMFGLTRTQIINDDMGALAGVPRVIGRGAALKLNKVFWTAFMNNAAFYTAARKNYFDGASSNLSLDTLTTAELMFLDQTDEDDNPLGVDPAVLLVPNAEFVNATNLMQSLEVRPGGGGSKTMVKNPHAGKFQVAKSSYLGNTAISGNSTKAWYLLADPDDVAVIEVVFLNGNETPTVESADADFKTLGIDVRGFHDFGVREQEYRGGVKSKGEA